ncbi:MAG: type II secretion system F family protein [Candidatus Omnitrophica bacterium]|nr:type II secretion system F family protein [Candidatus Omnitrophota bacterium]
MPKTMANFKYKIRDKNGRASTGTIEGETRESVANHFKQMGYVPILIEEGKSGIRNFSIFQRFFNRVSQEELIVFTRQLMTLQAAGVPILVSLGSITEQIVNPYFKRIIEEIINDIESGKSFSDAISRFPSVFSDIYTNMIRSGEAAGIMDDVLDRLATLMEHEQETKMRVQQAIRYPLLVIVVISIAFPILIMFIIPKFSALFAIFNTELPLPTKILLGVHFVISHYWPFIILAIIVLVFGFKRFIDTKSGRYAWDSVKLRVPVFGQIFLKISLSRFSRMTALLTASGIPIINTLEIIRDSLGNRVITDSVNNIIHGINEGKGIAEPMKLSKLFPSIVVQMVKIGEETGKINELLLKVSDYYDSQVDYTVKNLTVLIEPVLIFALGMMVLIMALAIFMPMWNLLTVFG